MTNALVWEGLAVLARANSALEDFRLRISPVTGTRDDWYDSAKRVLQEIDRDLLQTAQGIMVNTQGERDWDLLLEALGRTNQDFDHLSQALIDGRLPMLPDAPWPPGRQANEETRAEDETA